MNEKIKTFFACIGGFFTAAIAVLFGIFIGKNSGRNKSDDDGVATVEDQLTELERNQRTERQIYSDIGELFATIEKRNAEKKDRDRNN